MRLRSWVKYTLVVLATITVINIINFNDKKVNEFVNKCEKAGYSTEYCIAHS